MKLYGRFARGCFAVVLLCGGVVGLGTQGCGGGDDSGAGNNDDSGNNTNADGGIGIVAQNVSAYVGVAAQVDASQSTRPDGTSPLAFTWTLTGQPPTSKLSTADILGANTETPSIIPDVAGAFTLHAEAKTGDATGTGDVTVTGVNGDVYYVQVNGKDTPTTAQIQTVQMDGTNGHALSCKRTLFPADILGDSGTIGGFETDAGADAGFEALLLPTLFAGLLGPIIDVSIDTWESPNAGQPSRVAFGDFATAIGAGDGGSISLVAATTDNTCSNPPHPLHAVAAQGSSPNVWQPRFSPDGSRIAYVEDRGSADGGVANSTYEYISTVGFDGSDSHTVSTYCPVVTDGCWGDHLFPRRPQWQDATHVAWIRNTAGANIVNHPISWEIVSASDADNGAPTPIMTCTSYGVPYSFGFVSGPNLPANAILANYQASQTAAEDLVILAPDPAGNCQVVTNLTNLPGGAKESYARDFAISPDGTTVAFMMHSKDREDAGVQAPITDGGPQLNLNFVTSGGGEIWVVPVDGSKPAAPLNANPRYAYFGPRFISGGTRLAWNGQGPLPPQVIAEIEAGIFGDGGVGSSDSSTTNQLTDAFLGGQPAMVVAPVAGGDVTFVAMTDSDKGTFPLGGGNGGGCQCSPECGLSCPSNGSCDVASQKHPELPLTTTAIIGGVLFLRRRSRRKSEKKQIQKS